MKKAAFLSLALLVVLFFWTREHGSDEKLFIDKNSVIVAFGDSLSEGYGAPTDRAYPKVLQDILGVKVINAGISGEVSREGLARLPKILSEYKPQIVILCHGGNDILGRQNEAQIYQNLAQMIELITKSGAKTLLVGVPTFGASGIKTAGFYGELADKYELPYEADILEHIIETPSLKSDQIHPNAEGYAALAQSLSKFFKRVD